MAVEIKHRIRSFWAASPMTYGDRHGEAVYRRGRSRRERPEFGSQRFFELADETFYSWNTPLHDATGPFARLFDYTTYRDHPVLEVGCGMGCMAMNWSRQGARITAVDLNPVAVAQTRHRFALFGLAGLVAQADAESLPFPNNSFRFAYSWGVLHHTPGIRRAIAELYRVLEPGGGLGLMLYNRHSLLYQYGVRYAEGYLHLEDQFLDDLELASRYGDGSLDEGNPHTWPVTAVEAKRDLCRGFAAVQTRVLGTDVRGVLRSLNPLLSFLPGWMLHPLERRWGWSLWITARKPEEVS